MQRPCQLAIVGIFVAVTMATTAMSTATATGATQTTTEYEMVPLIQAGSLESASFTAES